MAPRMSLGVAALSFLLASVGAAPAAASQRAATPADHPETVSAWAWMTVRSPSTPANVPQTPNPKDTGQPVTFFGTGTYRHLAGVGEYEVTYPGTVPDLGAGQPIALVTPMSLSRRLCSVASVDDVGQDYVVQIRCFNSAGAPQDSRFSTNLIMADGAPTYSPPKSAAYVLADQPTAASYTPSFNHNSTHGAGSGPFNTVDRSSVGNYTVHIPGLGAVGGGNFQVSVHGSLAGYCRVSSWGVGSTASVKDVAVECRQPSGAPADREFALLFERKVGMDWGEAKYAAHVWGNQASSSSYTPAPPSTNWRSWSGTTAIGKLGTGWYRVTFNGIVALRGAAQVTAVGGGSTHCILGGIRTSGPTQTVDVRCFNASGAPVKARFMVSYLR